MPKMVPIRFYFIFVCLLSAFFRPYMYVKLTEIWKITLAKVCMESVYLQFTNIQTVGVLDESSQTLTIFITDQGRERTTIILSSFKTWQIAIQSKKQSQRILKFALLHAKQKKKGKEKTYIKLFLLGSNIS